MKLVQALPFRSRVLIWAALVLLTAPTVRSAEDPKPDPDAAAFFETSVRPVLVESCLSCHGPEKQRSDLRVDSREALLKGGALGPAIEPGNPEESLLIQALAHDDDGEVQMPPKGKLPDAAIEALTRWVAMGAPWGESAPEGTPDPATTHWAFQPLQAAEPPKVHGQSWVQTPVDAWILAGLEREGITPSPPADRRTLIRRATIDLLGAPPTLAEIEAFERDDAPDAFARVIDRLLASPFYGERWGRHWLDVARYADTKGYVFQEDRRYPYAYTYRDYVVDAFNNDLPFNQFILEQIAADQLSADGDGHRLAAMGFLTVGRRFLQDRNEIIDDRIDLVGRGLLGLTIACARCHDHKFDPIPTDDYYSLYGVFASSVEPPELPRIGRPGDTSPEAQEFERKLDEARKTRDDFQAAAKAEAKDGALNAAQRNELSKLNRAIDALNVESSSVIPRAMIMTDAPQPMQPHVFIRGNPGRPGKAVPRQFLEFLSGPDRKPFQQGSGRLELAQAIVDTARPLTARVIVNRVWAWHFGRGLVDSPSDFGVRSDPPSHPELLDELALGFLANGWSIKSLHRRIMLSSVYQQQSGLREDCMEKDAENRLLWRFNRQRLDFESMRDSILAVAGTLDAARGGPAVALDAASMPPRRTIYGFIDRQNLDGDYRSFDFASPDATSPKRFVTTVPQQALFLMNSRFVQEQAKHLAASIDREAGDSAGAVGRLYKRVLGRAPDAHELARASAFVDRPGASAEDSLPPLAQLAQVLMLTNEFLYVD